MVVAASIIEAPPSTKNEKGERDPEVRQARKGNEWHLGMKTLIGVEAQSGVVCTVAGTAANLGDVTQAPTVLHDDEEDVFVDAGYQGVDKHGENIGAPLKDAVQNRVNAAAMER